MNCGGGVLQQHGNKDCWVRVNSFLSELELNHGVCVEFIWLGTGMIFSVKNQEVKNGMVICAWQELRAFPRGPMPPCWPQVSHLLQHPLTLWDHTSTPAAGVPQQRYSNFIIRAWLQSSKNIYMLCIMYLIMQVCITVFLCVSIEV